MTYVKLICADVIDGSKTLEDESIDLIVTIPPYGVGMEYEKDVSQEEYDKLVVESCKEFKRVLKLDGRFAINVPLTMTKKNTSGVGEPYIIRLVMHTWEKAILAAGLQIRDYIAWDQSNSGMDTCWGSFKSASAPWIRHQIEMIIIGYNSQ
jgi:site-specific DNA-methyltransferase (adenine-specific)